MQELDHGSLTGRFEIEDRFRAVHVSKDLPLAEGVPGGDVPLDEGSLGFGGTLGGERQQDTKDVRGH